MAALMKATIERDEAKGIVSTYREKTISLSRAKELRVRPQEFAATESEGDGLGIKATNMKVNGGKVEENGNEGDGEDSGKENVVTEMKKVEDIAI